MSEYSSNTKLAAEYYTHKAQFAFSHSFLSLVRFIVYICILLYKNRLLQTLPKVSALVELAANNRADQSSKTLDLIVSKLVSGKYLKFSKFHAIFLIMQIFIQRIRKKFLGFLCYYFPIFLKHRKIKTKIQKPKTFIKSRKIEKFPFFYKIVRIFKKITFKDYIFSNFGADLELNEKSFSILLEETGPLVDVKFTFSVLVQLQNVQRAAKFYQLLSRSACSAANSSRLKKILELSRDKINEHNIPGQFGTPAPGSDDSFQHLPLQHFAETFPSLKYISLAASNGWSSISSIPYHVLILNHQGDHLYAGLNYAQKTTKGNVGSPNTGSEIVISFVKLGFYVSNPL